MIEIVLTHAFGATKVVRTLLADTGAGDAQSSFEILLDENDCIICAGRHSHMVSLGGAYSGTFPLFVIRMELPSLGYRHALPVIGVPSPPVGFDGIACFRFLSRFTYGNFGQPSEFGLGPRCCVHFSSN